jgi:endonuclease/exonuclease/phosphatase family protein
MAHMTFPRIRVAALVGVAAIILALLAHPGDSFATPRTDPEIAAAEAAVRDAEEAVHRAKAATWDARSRRDEISARVARHTSSLHRSAQRLDDTRQAVTTARERVQEARTRLERAQTPRVRRAARQHLRRMRARTSALRAENVAAKEHYLLARAAVDRATGALARAQTGLAQAFAELGAARVVLAQANEHYAELLALATQQITAAVANIPNRVSDGRFRWSMASLTATRPDVIVLNEISSRSVEGLRAAAPGYDAYRGGTRLTEPGAASQSISNAVMWRTDTYEVVAKGRIKVVDDDRGYHHKRKFLWDRFATWVTLRSLADGRISSVISTHMPTNPEKFPRQYGDPALTRVQLYGLGMDKLVALARQLSTQGRVLLGGDMNSHPNQGYWTAVAKMRAAGYAYTKDRGVMYLFHPLEASVPSSQQLQISSDHPALLTTLQFG